MKAVVEFGRPLLALPEGSPCGLSGSYVCDSAAKANKLAKQLCHVFENRPDINADYFLVSRIMPRITYWNLHKTFWVTVTLLDGTLRGSFAATVK